MSYIKFEHRHLGDASWLDVSSAAFTVHAWALDYCNEQATDGRVENKIALRLVCPVLPGDLEAAWTELVDAGFWERTEGGYTCPGFTAHGILAEEQDATRQKWAEDKRRQRLHNIGNHQLCNPGKCAPARSLSTTGQVQMSTTGQVDDQTRPDQTRPDPTPEGGSGMGSGAQGGQQSAHGSAAPPAATWGVYMDDSAAYGDDVPVDPDTMTPDEIAAGKEAGARVLAEIRAFKEAKKAEGKAQREEAAREADEQKRIQQAELDRQLAELQARESS